MVREARKILRKKVNIPLKLKIAALTSLLLLMTVGFYVAYATSIFKEEKAADIYLISVGNSTNLSDKVELIADKYLKLIGALAKTNASNINEELKRVTAVHPDLLGVSCLKGSDPTNPITHYQESDEVTQDSLKSLIDIDLKTLSSLPIGFIQFKRSSAPPFLNHFVLNAKNDFFACALHLSLDSLTELNRGNEQFESFIVNSDGKMFFNISKKAEYSEQTQEKYSQNMKSDSGVFKYKQNQESKIIAYAKVPSFDLYALTEIPEKKAFEASELLIKKSIYFGLALLSFALIFGILFSNSLTGALTYLSSAADAIAAGDFATPIDHSKATNDEVGSLNFTFENMRKKIVAYMEEMKEKYRLENEVKVAQIVQSSFFPQTSFSLYDTTLYGAYAPASECGGDWWGYIEQGSKVTVVICDATGHGVPAALLTAAAHSTVSNLKLESQKRYISPSEILSRLNQVVSLMNSSVQLTGFAFEVDGKSGEYKYSNASHQPALIFSQDLNDKVYSKGEILPLQESNGARLGESFDSTYHEISGILKLNDFVILYTDGILEFEREGKAFGQRNFFKHILDSLNDGANNPESLTRNFMLKFQDFQGNNPLQDDITFLAVSYNKSTSLAPVEIQNINDLENISNLDKIIISSLDNPTNIEKILIEKKIFHLIGKNSISINDEIEEINFFKNSSPVKHDYIFQTFLESNDQISFVTQTLIEEIEKRGISKINTANVAFVVEELLSNAFYHSIHNPEKNRAVKITSSDSPIEISAEVTDKTLAIYVESSTPNPGIETLLASIRRGQIEKSPRLDHGGAGLGLYLIFEHAHQFWIIEKNNKLGFRIVFERFNRNIQAEERITSFHYIKL